MTHAFGDPFPFAHTLASPKVSQPMASEESFPELSQLVSCVQDTSQPIGKRTHAAFFLRTLATPEAVDAIAEGELHALCIDYCVSYNVVDWLLLLFALAAALKNKADSCLLRHELAYILGQIQDSSACSVLEGILGDTGDDVMVRHECAEALGAIGSPDSLDVLRQFSTDPLKEISETCQLAIDLIDWRQVRVQRGPVTFLVANVGSHFVPILAEPSQR